MVSTLPPQAARVEPLALETAAPPFPSAKPESSAPKPLLKRYEGVLVPALVLFVLGNFLAATLPDLAFAQPGIGLGLIALLAGVLVMNAGQKRHRFFYHLSLWLMVLIMGSIHFGLRHFQPAANDIATLTPLDRAEITGIVDTLQSKNRAVIQISTVNGKPASGRVMTYLPRQGMDLSAGTRVLVTGDLRQPFTSPIPGTFDQATWLSNQRMTALLRHPERLIAFEISHHPVYLLQRMTDGMKTRVTDTFTRALPSPHAEVLGGIVLGDKAIPVDRDTRLNFIQTGLVHILAASGLNVGIIAGAVLALLNLTKMAYRPRLGIAMAAVAFYSLLTGLPPSIQRAAAMLEIALMLKMMNRQLSPVFLLCVAGTLLVLLNPENIRSIGFQFSVLTTFGLITMVPPLQEKLGFYMTRWLAGLLLVPIVAQLWVWPLSVYYFNQFPIHSVPLNLVAVLLVTPLTVLGFTAGLISLILPPLAQGLAWLAQPFLISLLWIVQWGSAQTWAQWNLASPPSWAVTLIYGELLVALLLVHRLKTWSVIRRTALALAPLSVVLLGLCLNLAQAGQQTRIALLPLSNRTQAYLIEPAGVRQPLLVMPQHLAYYEARHLSDYLKHRQLTQLAAVLLLPAKPFEGSAKLATAFKHARVALWLLPLNTILSDDLPGRTEFYPAQGARMHLGGAILQGDLGSLQLLQDRACLLSIADRYTSNANCAIQAIREDSGTRLYADDATLSGNRFYQLTQQGNQLTVHTPTRPKN